MLRLQKMYPLLNSFCFRRFSGVSFTDAQIILKSLKTEPSNEEKLRLYALFKQSTVGENFSPKPGMLDFVGSAKWQAWKKLGPMSSLDAEKEYVSLVKRLSGGVAASEPTTAASIPQLILPSGSGKSVVYRAPLDTSQCIEAIVLNSPPVNALSSEVIGSLTAALQAACKDPNVRGIVLASSQPNIFSGGLDIREMAMANEASFARFWGEIQGLFLTLYPLEKPIVAAIEGSAPAGGCWLALQCDYRVLLDEPRAVMGLNEVQLGIVAPPWFAKPLEVAVGPRMAESMLQLGTLLPPEKALSLGAVDALAPRGHVLQASFDAACRYAAIPSSARHLSKLMLRHTLIESLATPELRAADLARTWKFFQTPDVQEGLKMYLERLKRKK